MLEVRAQPAAFQQATTATVEGWGPWETFGAQVGAGIVLHLVLSAIPGINLCNVCLSPVVAPLLQTWLGNRVSNSIAAAIWPVVAAFGTWTCCVVAPGVGACGVVAFTLAGAGAAATSNPEAALAMLAPMYFIIFPLTAITGCGTVLVYAAGPVAYALVSEDRLPGEEAGTLPIFSVRDEKEPTALAPQTSEAASPTPVVAAAMAY